MNDQTISKGNRIKLARGRYGKVQYVSPNGTVWYHDEETRRYAHAKCDTVERVHGLKGVRA